MRAFLSVLLLAALASQGLAQGNPAEGGDKPKAEVGEAAEAPAAWKLPEREAKKLDSLLKEFLHPKKPADRKATLQKLKKFVAKEVDGHSVLEDVDAIARIANRHRFFNPKLTSKRGKLKVEEVKPETHGFPGKIGTVKYHLYLPTKYSEKQLWPLLFCMPDNKKWPDGAKYIVDAWVKRSPKIADGFVIAVPIPRTKGEAWTDARSYARAMIALRHVSGNFESTKKHGGPAVDMMRVFIDGEDAAALVAARFPEMFAGAILHRCDGRAGTGPNLRTSGRLSGLAAFAIFEEAQKRQKEFAERLKADNAAGMAVRSEDVGPLGNAKTIVAWMEMQASRVPQPTVIGYTIHDPSFQRHYWINVLGYEAAMKGDPIFDATADRAKNEVRIDLAGISRFELFLSDALVDLSKKVRIVVVEKDQEYEFLNDMVPRDVAVLLDELLATNHPWRIFPAKFVVDLADLRAKAAKAEADKAKAAQKQNQDKKPDKATKGK
ncbi:MAG: hypothetical protein ACYTF8_13400 [Planctomycetota bacterium]|jgi:hypothetical protein